MVQVPQMAESISEGTLKQFSKQVGDYVEQDEEIATIETDKIDVAVNAPVAGTIKEFLANEEDTVTVGQDLVRLELGGEPGEKKAPAKEEPKDAAPAEQKTPRNRARRRMRRANSPSRNQSRSQRRKNQNPRQRRRSQNLRQRKRSPRRSRLSRLRMARAARTE